MDFLSQIAARVGMERSSHRTSFNSRKGSVVGMLNGAIACVCITPSVRVNGIPVQHQVVTTLRFPRITDPNGLRAALEHCPGVRAFGKKPRVLTVTDDTVTWCVITKWSMQPERFAAALNEVTACARQFAAPFAANCCELCGASARVVMLNGLPVFTCDACQQKTRAEQEQASQEYALRKTDYGALVTFSLIAISVYPGIAALAGWLVGHNAGRVSQIFVIALPCVFGAGFGKLLAQHIGRIKASVAIGLFFFTLTLGFAGHFVFMVSLLSTMEHYGALTMARWLASRFFSFLFTSDQFLFVFSDFCLASAAALTLWQQRPTFAAKFEELSGSSEKVMAAAK